MTELVNSLSATEYLDSLGDMDLGVHLADLVRMKSIYTQVITGLDPGVTGYVTRRGIYDAYIKTIKWEIAVIKTHLTKLAGEKDE
jgi:hypothetical protein